MYLVHILNGLSMGSAYALIALGYTMVYGTLGFINFAHGSLYAVGAFIGFYFVSILHWPLLLAMATAMLLTGTIGVTMEKIAYRPLRKQSRLVPMISSIGMATVLQTAIVLINGPQTETYVGLSYPTWTVAGSQISSLYVIILGISIFLMAGLQYIVRRTRIGTAMRCVSESIETTSLMGISVDTVMSFTFFIGSALGCAAGVLTGVVYHAITPYMGILAGLKAFVAAVIGGIGSIPGAMLGGILLGSIEYFTVILISSSWRDATAFTLLIIFLLVRPTGILGAQTRNRA